MELFLRCVFAPCFRRAGGCDRRSFNELVRRIWWQAYSAEFPARMISTDTRRQFVWKFHKETSSWDLRNIESGVVKSTLFFGPTCRIAWARSEVRRNFFNSTHFQRWKCCQVSGCCCVLSFEGKVLAFERKSNQELLSQFKLREHDQHKEINRLSVMVLRLTDLTKTQAKQIEQLTEACNRLGCLVFNSSGVVVGAVSNANSNTSGNV